MEENTIVEFTGRDRLSDPLNDLLKKGAEQLLSAAIEIEVETLLARFEDRRTAEGRAGVVRNGYHPERAIQTGIGPVTVKIPKVRAKSGTPVLSLIHI